MDTRVASAPGRVTVLGEHTDYNGGTSLGVATEERTTVVASPGPPGLVEVRSQACGTATSPLEAPAGPAFVVVAASLAALASVDGAVLEVSSGLPLGAGVSSSAAYAVAVALALGLTGDPLGVARSCQDAERTAGSDVGLLDQLVVLAARRGQVVDLDFSVLGTSTFPLSSAVGLSVVDTGERRLVAHSAYALRRAECAAAAALVGPLGRATRDDCARIEDASLRARARHVVSECERVAAGRRALRDGDLATLGALLDESHRSLRDDFEVSTPTVESVRDELAAHPGVAGVRLCGAGFGGSLVVAHDPAIDLASAARWSSRLEGGDGASVSPPR